MTAKKISKAKVKKAKPKKTVLKKVHKVKKTVKRTIKKAAVKKVKKPAKKVTGKNTVFRKLSSVKQLEIKALEVREDLIRMLAYAGSGHSAGPLDLADIFTALYFNILNHNPKRPWDPKRDRLIVSNGHICPVWYTALAHAGYFPKEEIKTLRKFGTRLQGHPHMHSAPGVENSAGPLGQGISLAAGVAYGAKMDKKKYTVYCSMGDGELQEGQCWEAFMFAAKYKLDNLIVFVDRNYIQIDGNTEDVMPLDPLDKKFESFGWNAINIDGHDFKEIINGFKKAKSVKGKPTVIIAKTVPGKGVFYMEGKYQWHGKPPTKDQAEIALQELATKEMKMKGIKCTRCEVTLDSCVCVEGE